MTEEEKRIENLISNLSVKLTKEDIKKIEEFEQETFEYAYRCERENRLDEIFGNVLNKLWKILETKNSINISYMIEILEKESENINKNL